MKSNLLAMLIILSVSVSAQKKDDQWTVVFYNVENLFDTLDNPDKIDEEFTPGSEKIWNYERYEKKLVDIARVMKSVNSSELPEIIGLCEVENEQVLQDLVKTKSLRRGEYGIVHMESPDIRGIDVALLYRTDEFTPTDKKALTVVFPFDSTETTRDILYVKGKTSENETLHLFVNHWSSRRDGQRETEPKRIFAAVTLRKEIDMLLNSDSDAKIIIMGDFNDEPTNNSTFGMLMANNKKKNASGRDLYNLMYDMHNEENKGTYNFRGNWNMLDQIIISQALLSSKSGLHTTHDGGKIFREDWMMYNDERLGEKVPGRTYGGPNYYGGVSDHLPVYAVFRKK
jgi:predicted extracellular nuclease